MEYRYKPQGVCAQEMILEVENGIIKKIQVTGGCDGNKKGIAKLVEGMKVVDVIKKLKGTTCGNKSTSCPDQLTIALEKIQKEQ